MRYYFLPVLHCIHSPPCTLLPVCDIVLTWPRRTLNMPCSQTPLLVSFTIFDRCNEISNVQQNHEHHKHNKQKLFLYLYYSPSARYQSCTEHKPGTTVNVYSTTVYHSRYTDTSRTWDAELTNCNSQIQCLLSQHHKSSPKHRHLRSRPTVTHKLVTKSQQSIKARTICAASGCERTVPAKQTQLTSSTAN